MQHCNLTVMFTMPTQSVLGQQGTYICDAAAEGGASISGDTEVGPCKADW